MERSAIFHDANKRYCYAIDPGKFLIRLQTKRGDIKRVVLHYQDKYLPLMVEDTRRTMDMRKVASSSYHDYYECVVEMDVVCLRYFFELEDFQGEVAFYGDHTFLEEPFTDIDRMYDCPQNLREEEQFCVPEWAKNKVVYQIFPSSFATGKEKVPENWYRKPASHRESLGGDLRGIINHLDYLEELGVEVLYLTPIFVSDSSHKYDIKDYYHIDPAFGTDEDLAELVEKAHSRGLRVVLDAVFNHTSRDFFAFRDVLEKEWESEYIDWYFIKEFPLRGNRGEKPNYKCFSYFGGMPKLNLRNPATADYFINVACYWLKQYHIDGWRLDVGDEISHTFWKRFRREVRAVNPEALIVGEIWHYAGDFLEGDEWDSVMNYPFCYAVRDFVIKEESRVSDFVAELDFIRGHSNIKAFPTLINLIDSHDTDRFLQQCQNRKEKLKFAAALQLLLPGMPMIYYGDEVGMTGEYCRMGMLWDRDRQDEELFAWYKKLIQIRKAYPELLDWDKVERRVDEENQLLLLTCRKDGQTLTVIFHRGAGEVKVDYAGAKNLLTGEAFDGEMQDFETVVLLS